MTRLSHALNAGGIVAILVAAGTALAAALYAIAGPDAGPHPYAAEQMMEAAQLIESTILWREQ